jgi:predicted GIY-YIG superfamily endonuclease
VIAADAIDLIDLTFPRIDQMSYEQLQSRQVVDLTRDVVPAPTQQPIVGHVTFMGDAATRGSAAVVEMTPRRTMLPATGISSSVTVRQHMVCASAAKCVIDLTDERTDGARFRAPVPSPCGNIPCVYVLEHTATFRTYTGQTNALQRRLSEHLGGRGCATTARDPKRRWRCALVVSGFEDRNAARLFEAFLKRKPGLEAKIRATRRAIASEKGQRLRMELL